MASSNYTAYETADGRCLEAVEAYCMHLTSDGHFNDETVPAGNDVERGITSSYYLVAGILAKNGYAVAQTDTEVLGILQELNALDAAIRIELSNPITGIGEPNERFNALQARRDEIISWIENSQMLTVLGAEEADVGSASELLLLTGISKARKRSVEDDTDYIKPRFRRGFGKNPRTSDSAYAETDYRTGD